MDLEMVLNELSLLSPATDVHVARQRMSDLMQTVVVATTHGVKRTLRTHSNLDSEELAPGYPIARWRNDSSVDRDLQRFFRTLVTKSPFLEDVADPGILQSVGLSDFFHGEDSAIGLGMAYWLEALAISLRSEPRWYDSHLQIRIVQLDEHEEMTDTVEEIAHMSSSEHISEHLDWIKERLRNDNLLSVRDGMTIWKHKSDWFPNLYFCEQVEKKMQALPRGNLLLMPIMKRLQELEDFCNVWREGPFDHNMMLSKVTNESEATIETYGNERMFLCHDDTFRMFRWHVRLTPGAWRLYFYPLPEERKLIIGYIGPHLRTVQFH